MPAQKRAYDTTPPSSKDDDDSLQHNRTNHHEPPPSPPPQPDHHDADESDRSPSSSNNEDGEEKDEYVVVKLPEIRKEVQCPICLDTIYTMKYPDLVNWKHLVRPKYQQSHTGWNLKWHYCFNRNLWIIRKTRTVMECLHRFCRECIDKSMRLGNNECPACRTHCASRRSLRDDPNYDALIAALYPDIDKYEEEELAFHEEEKARNKQIQASIAQTFRRQAEALGRKRTTAKATAAALARRSLGRYHAHSRGRRNYRAAELQESDDNEDTNGDGGKDSSSADEHSADFRSKRHKRWAGARSTAANADGGGDEHDSENRESMGATAGLVGPSERLAWGKGGMRSHTRHGSASASNGKHARNSRISKLADYLRNLEEYDNESDIRLMLVSIDDQRLPSLRRPYLCCSPTLSVKNLRQYVALQTALQANEVEIYLVKELNSKCTPSTSTNFPIFKPVIVDPDKDELQVLEEQETLAGLKTINFTHGHLLLAYRKKPWD